jgi:Ca2+-binding RTX toxin-like protein/DNA-binding beta-propeller fold protein YncE
VPRLLRRAVAPLLLLTVLAAVPAARARVAVVAAGRSEAILLDVVTNHVLARVALPGPATAVAMAPDGRRAYVAAGSVVAALDLSLTPAVAESAVRIPAPTVRALGGPVTGLARGTAAGPVVAVTGSRLVILDPAGLRVLGRVELHGAGRAPALTADGGTAAVPLAGGRVAIVAVGARRLVRRVKVEHALAAAFDRSGTAWVSTRTGRLFAIRPGAHKPAKHPLDLHRPMGATLSPSPDHLRLVAGATGGQPVAGLIDLATRRVSRIHVGAGPGAAAWSSDATRIYVADRGGATLSLVSPYSRRRLGTVAFPGEAPQGVAVQGGLARSAGSDAGDTVSGSRLPDYIEGLGGDDVLRGGRENDVLVGGEGNDILVGGSYDDRLEGGPGDDRLLGESGNDRMSGGTGADSGDGGTGNDTVHLGTGDDSYDGGPGDDRIYGEEGNDRIVERTFGNDRRLYGGPGDDYIDGGRGSDLIKGGDGDDQLFGGTGTEHINGGDGNDALDGGRARDLLFGNNGDDAVHGDQGDDYIDGGNGSDQLDGGSGEDSITGGPGNDAIVAGPGADDVDAGPGDDIVRAADESQDTIDCGDGQDTVYVEESAPTRDLLISCETVLPAPAEAADDESSTNVISGTEEADTLYGTAGPDSMFGKGGDDKIFGKAGDDYLDGEYGKDEIHGEEGNDTIAGRGNDDLLYGGPGDDYITGDRGADRIFGQGGNDTLFGNLGPDLVDGGAGDDRINVVRGEIDTVRCGPGRDVVFADPADHVAGDCESVRR